MVWSEVQALFWPIISAIIIGSFSVWFKYYLDQRLKKQDAEAKARSDGLTSEATFRTAIMADIESLRDENRQLRAELKEADKEHRTQLAGQEARHQQEMDALKAENRDLRGQLVALQEKHNMFVAAMQEDNAAVDERYNKLERRHNALEDHVRDLGRVLDLLPDKGESIRSQLTTEGPLRAKKGTNQ